MATTYKIGEAAALLNLKTYVLRFWETEFSEIVPLRTEKGQRLYTEEHLALLERIRYLLHDRGLTIGGARRTLAEERARGVPYVFGTASAVARHRDVQNDPLAENPLPDPVGEDGDTPSCPRQCGVEQRSQWNLPGLEQIVALREAAGSSTKSGAVANGNEESGPEKANGGQAARGMLPLFAVVRSAFLAGKAAGASLPGKGGDNFIQTGEGAAGKAVASEKTAPLSDDREETLGRIASELEQIASILRADTPAAPRTGRRSPESF